MKVLKKFQDNKKFVSVAYKETYAIRQKALLIRILVAYKIVAYKGTKLYIYISEV